MAETFETLKAKLGDWFGVDTARLPDSVRGDTINLIQRQIMRRHDLRFGETTDTLALVAGTGSYTLPTLWSRPLNLWYTNPSTNSVTSLQRQDRDEFDLLYPDTTDTGTPLNYTVWGSSLIIGPTPDQNITLNRNYYAILTDLADVSPNNTNDFVAQAWEVLFYGSLAYVARYMLEDSRIAVLEAKFLELEADLVSEHRRERSSGRIPQSQEPG